MSLAFYKSIIEDEIKVFGVKEESLKRAVISVGKTYSRRSLNTGETFLDYNIPSNRCAYLYKFASLHTGLVSKYFLKLMRKKQVKSSLNKKKTLKICCLGGGPGTDIVGLFKALAVIPYYHTKVVEVTILDICGGWRNSFKRIISNLIEGKVKDVPETFINKSNFKFELIEVNLLCSLPSTVVKVISEADIICMVKFVSAILGSSTSVSALQLIGEKMKVGSVVLFIDNSKGDIFKPFFDIAGHIGLEVVLGPLHEHFGRKVEVTANERNIYGCLPLAGTKITVLGFIKSNIDINLYCAPMPAPPLYFALAHERAEFLAEMGSEVCNNVINSSTSNILSKDLVYNNYDIGDDDVDDDSWDTDDESENSLKKVPSIPLGYAVKVFSDKSTQTNKYARNNTGVLANPGMETVQPDELYFLIDHLCRLVNVLKQWKQRTTAKKCCCH